MEQRPVKLHFDYVATVAEEGLAAVRPRRRRLRARR